MYCIGCAGQCVMNKMVMQSRQGEMLNTSRTACALCMPCFMPSVSHHEDLMDRQFSRDMCVKYIQMHCLCLSCSLFLFSVSVSLSVSCCPSHSLSLSLSRSLSSSSCFAWNHCFLGSLKFSIQPQRLEAVFFLTTPFCVSCSSVSEFNSFSCFYTRLVQY